MTRGVYREAELEGSLDKKSRHRIRTTYKVYLRSDFVTTNKVQYHPNPGVNAAIHEMNTVNLLEHLTDTFTNKTLSL